MSDTKKTKAQLIAELKELRRRVADFDRSKAEGKRAKDSIRALQAITERKRAEEALKKAKEYAQNIIDSSLDMIVSVDKDRRIVQFNKAACDAFGYTEEEILGKHIHILYADEEEGLRVHSHILEKGMFTGEIQNVRKNGEVFPTLLSAGVFRNENGEVIGLVGNSREITDRKRAEAEVRQVSEYFQDLVGSAGDAIIAVDQELKITVWNTGAERIFGYTQEEALGKPPSVLLGGVDESEEVEQMGRRFLDGHWLEPYEAKRYRKDGTVVWVYVTASPLRNVDGKVIGYSVIFKDITEEMRIREQLVQSEKMSSLGELISGVAHELNNPLTSVIGFSQLSMLQPDLSPKVRSNLEKVTSEAERAAHIVQNLLTFASQRKPKKVAVSINNLLRRTVDLRAYYFRVNNIEVVEELDRELPQTVADPYQLQQVFLNVVTNAEQAMEEAHGRGRLTLRTSQWQDGETKSWIRVQIEDDGPGIPEGHLSRIFDPFFTTKQELRGTGLGLSTCYGIVQEHGGRISVQTAPGQGANFIIDLPLAQEEVETTRDKDLREVTIPSGKSVLIVDDEGVLLEMLSQLLEVWDHQVEAAVSGRSAMCMLEEKDYNLIIMDYKMPDIGGRELYLWLKNWRPHLASRVLLITGDTVSPSTQAFLDETGLPSLAKPFTLSEAEAMIEKVLAPGTGGEDVRESWGG